MRLVPTAAVTLALLVPGLAVTATAAEAAAPTCNGLRATIVGNARSQQDRRHRRSAT